MRISWFGLLAPILLASCYQQLPDHSVALPSATVLLLTQVDSVALQLRYLQADGSLHLLKAAEPGKEDTLQIEAIADQWELEAKGKYHSIQTFRLNVGDTIEARVFADSVSVSVLNREPSDLALNYEQHWLRRIGKERRAAHRIPILEWLEWANSPGEKKLSIGAWMKQQRADMETAVQIEFEAELQWQDSLLARGELEESTYQYRRQNALLLHQAKMVEWKLEAFSRFPTEHNLTAEDLSLQYSRDGISETWIENVLSPPDSSLLQIAAYQSLLQRYWHFFGRKVNRHTDRIDHNGKPGALINHPDYVERFDSVAASPWLSESVAQVMHAWEVEEVLTMGKLADRERLMRQYEALYTDSVRMQGWTERFRVNELNQPGESQDLALVDMDGDETSFQKLLQAHSGKVIYLDFWSSTCRPCLGEMAHRAQFLAQLPQGEVVCLYISLDAEKTSWHAAAKRFQLLEHSFWVQNKYTSRELANMGIDWLPWYQVYDRNGKLVVPYASRPSEAETIAMIQNWVGKP